MSNKLKQLSQTCWQTIGPYRARLGGAIVALTALSYLITRCHLSTPLNQDGRFADHIIALIEAAGSGGVDTL